MKQAIAALCVVAATACGSTTPGATLNEYQLKFRIFDQVGPPAYCDPDFYPVVRAGAEQASALANYAQIRDNSELYSAIVEHEHLPTPPAELTDAQKLTLYRAFKKLRALDLHPGGSGTSFFEYTTADTYTKVQGSVSADGKISVTSKTQGSRPNCPICLSASTLIGTPNGPIVVTAVRPGMLVWTQEPDGTRAAVPVIAIGSTPVPPSHLMVHLTLADGREVWASPGHRTSDGRTLGSLAVGDVVDGSRVSGWELVPYTGDRTYDLLPAGPTGTYWANGLLLSSTLR
ncbi:MAG TPA: hypothetical protein VFL29_08830 [Candidatus Dormibacteraeota bacterium]|nr:hypothetical protein [Candidatus Dormibacteraeota bacterium]